MIYYNIVVDADDVLENFLDVWVNELNERYGLNYTVEAMKQWDMKSNIPNLTEEEIYSPLKDDSLWEMLMPKRDAVKFLEQLQADGHNVYICTTHTTFETIKTKLFRLQELFPFIDASQYIVASDKNMIRADIMIDDGVHNFASINYPCIKLLFDRPHNRSIDCAYTDMTRVESWDAIYSIVSALSNECFICNAEAIIDERIECGEENDEIE